MSNLKIPKEKCCGCEFDAHFQVVYNATAKTIEIVPQNIYEGAAPTSVQYEVTIAGSNGDTVSFTDAAGITVDVSSFGEPPFTIYYRVKYKNSKGTTCFGENQLDIKCCGGTYTTVPAELLKGYIIQNQNTGTDLAGQPVGVSLPADNCDPACYLLVVLEKASGAVVAVQAASGGAPAAQAALTAAVQDWNGQPLWDNMEYLINLYGTCGDTCPPALAVGDNISTIDAAWNLLQSVCFGCEIV